MKYHENIRLVADRLACQRGGRLVFEDLSFDIGASDFLHLKGANGSGKTTLLRLLAGLIPAKSGSLMYDGELLETISIPDTSSFVYSGHHHGLKAVLTLRENSAAYYQLMTGYALSDKLLRKATTLFGLEGLIDHPVRFFSSGQTHRCALLRFALLERPVWLMDEPTVGLDGLNRKRLFQLMEAHLAKGGSIIAASHDPIDLPRQELEMANFVPHSNGEEGWL